MKKVSINPRFTALVLAFAFVAAFAVPASANDEKNVIPVELKFLGNFKNQPLFQLSFTNAIETEFTVVVRDEFNTVLYKDNVKGGTFTKKFLFNTDELGDATLRFEITGSKDHKPAIFEISKNSRYIQDVVVSKLK
jgi:hypothetical protein